MRIKKQKTKETQKNQVRKIELLTSRNNNWVDHYIDFVTKKPLKTWHGNLLLSFVALIFAAIILSVALDVKNVSLATENQSWNPTHAGSLTNGTGGALLLGPAGVVVSGDYAYIASTQNSALEVVNISDPTSPTHAGALTHGTDGAMLLHPRSVAVSGSYAYVVSLSSNSLEIINISDPNNPIHAGSIVDGDGGALLETPVFVTVSGDYAYIASASSNALEIINISDPTNPTHAGSLTHGTGGALLSNPSSVAVSGNYAYIASSLNNALEIINISDPNNPTHAGSLTNGTGGALLSNPLSVAISGNYAFVASYLSNALEIVNISNPVSPFHVGSLIDGSGGALLANPYSVTVSGGYAYVASYSSNALEVVNISNVSTPVHAGSLTHGTDGAILSYPISVAVSGDYAYLTSTGAGALEIINIGKNNSSPTEENLEIKDQKFERISTVTSGMGGVMLQRPRGIFVENNYAYVVSLSGLEILDVSDSKNPAHVSVVALSDSPYDVKVQDGFAYIISQQSNLFEVIDVREPKNPQKIGKISYARGFDENQQRKLATLYGVEVSGKYAYIPAFRNNAIEIIDISDPNSPRFVSRFTETSGQGRAQNPSDVVVKNNHAYVATWGTDALDILNVENPLEPKHVGRISHAADGAPLQYVTAVDVSGKYAYLVSRMNNALTVVDISNPSSPKQVGVLYHGQGGSEMLEPNSISVSGHFAYITSSKSNALEVVDISKPESPKHYAKVVYAGSSRIGTFGSHAVHATGKYVYVSLFEKGAIDIFKAPDSSGVNDDNDKKNDNSEKKDDREKDEDNNDDSKENSKEGEKQEKVNSVDLESNSVILEEKIKSLSVSESDALSFQSALNDVKNNAKRARDVSIADPSSSEVLLENSELKLNRLNNLVDVVLGSIDQNIEKDKDWANIKNVSREYERLASRIVYNLNLIGDAEEEISSQVKLVAQEENDAKVKISKAMMRVESRGIITKVLFGPDYASLKVVRAELLVNQNRIKTLADLMEKSQDPVVKIAIESQIKEFERQNESLVQFVTKSVKGVSLLGWLFRFFV